MEFEPKKRNRLVGYDYSQDGYYFITVVTNKRKTILGNIISGEFKSAEYGELTSKVFNDIPAHYPGVKLDDLILMPNHIHAIIVINFDGSARPGQEFVEGKNNYGLLSKIIKSFKYELTKQCKTYKLQKLEWQRSFYDHIIRDEKGYLRIKEYMKNNPLKWELDAENPAVNGDSYKYYKALLDQDEDKP